MEPSRESLTNVVDSPPEAVEEEANVSDVLESFEIKVKPKFDLTSFLRLIYPLNRIHTKFVHVGLYKQLNYRPGVLFLKQGHKRFIFMEADSFLKLAAALDAVSYALNNIEDVSTRKFGLLDCPVQVKIRIVFSKPQVEIKMRDGIQSILLNMDELICLVHYLPSIKRYIEHLTANESWMIEHIDRVMRSENVYVPPPQQMVAYEADRLHDEVVAYKLVQHSID